MMNVWLFLRKKQQKRVLPDWILKGGKKVEPLDTEKITSAKAEKNNSKVEILKENVKRKKNNEKNGKKKGGKMQKVKLMTTSKTMITPSQ